MVSLIIDAYTRKIVGYDLHPTLEAVGCLNALRMAISTRKYELPFCLVHHSDRGVQYYCSDYVDTLNSEGTAISMTQNGSPYDNALAERVNGIIKMNSIQKRFIKITKKHRKRYPKLFLFITQSVLTAV